MNGHLQRLAARSVGSSVAASARPRLPARFEPFARDGGPGPEVLDEVPTPVAATPAPSPGSADRSTGGRREAASAARADVARVIPRSASPPWSAAAAADGPAAPPVAPRAAASATARARAAAPSAMKRTPAPADARPAPQRRTPAAASARVTAMPVAQGRPAPAPDRGEPAAARPVAEAAVVRVHIGRLEVRANLQPAPAAAPVPARAESPPEDLALSAYLRGERSAR